MLAKYERCEKCGTFLMYEDELNYQSDAYEIDGSIYCEDCFVDAAKETFYKRLKE